jgi:uncharacterized protein
MKKISVISGGSGGLGLAIAEILIKSGKNILILGRNESKLTRAAKKLSRLADTSHVSTLVCNVGNEKDVKNLGKFLKDHKIVTEYLFNNAGRGLSAGYEETTGELIDNILEANLRGMILLTTEILKSTPENEELTIVNIMSTSGLTGRANETVYCAAKWGARGYTEALRAELSGKKRNVIAIYPGGMKTDFYKTSGQAERDISGFMNPAHVAEKIVNAVTVTDKTIVTDVTITRKK